MNKIEINEYVAYLKMLKTNIKFTFTFIENNLMNLHDMT